LVPIAFETACDNFHHALATLKVELPEARRPLTLISAHLCPNGPVIRRREAAYLAVQAAPDSFKLLTGDFNSASPHDTEPAGFDTLPAHHRVRYLADDLKRADRSVLAHLEAAGWVDIGHALDRATIPTVPTAAFTAAEFATMRCDCVLATAALAACAKSYEVIRTPATDMASDHYPIVATFEVPA
jgi:endonuclease/exonuclease/phosphatase family metal-dependent hydrolase